MGFVPSLAMLFTLAAAADPTGESGIHVHSGKDGDDRCTIEKGPNDLVSRDGPLVVPENARAEEVVALRGDVTVKRGAVVKKVVAVAGSIRIEQGATVTEDVVAVGGNVRISSGARVGEDVLALGGKLDVREGAQVGGTRLAFDLSIAGVDVRRKVLEELHLEGCVIEPH